MKKRGTRPIEWTVLIGCILLILAVAGVLVWLWTKAQNHIREKGFGLFVWEEEVIEEEQWEELASNIEQADVTILYQNFSKRNLNEAKPAPFVKMLYEKGVDVYALVGKAEWAYETDGEHLIKWIRRVAAYNVKQGTDSRIRGIMVDVEPYLLEEWDAGEEARTELMRGYLDGIKKGYVYAKDHGLTYLVCIPTFYDATNDEILQELIAEGCDGVAVMNYNRQDEYGQICKEVDYAMASDKQVICIYELQPSGNHDLEDINTYATVGLDALWESAGQLEEQFDYDKLRFAYHYYSPLREMLEHY